MEYYQYFRLTGPPFQPASPQAAVYFSPTHLKGLATLEAGLLSDLSGLTMLTGEAGTGKTTLIYSLLQRDHKRVRIAHISDPKLSFLEIMRVVLTQMNLYSPGSTKLDYLSVLDHLLDLHGKEERIAIVVDESQVLSDDVLEELRLLSNRGQRNDRCLQLILVGQPELAERLKQPQLRQLNQRISSRGMLEPLNATEAVIYVECKLDAQGGKCSEIFERRALNQLIKRSDGIPRKINMLCHTAMMASFYANERKVSYATAKKVAAEYHDSVGIIERRSRLRALLMPAFVASAALVFLTLLGLVYPNPWSEWLMSHSASDKATAQTVQSLKKGKHLRIARRAKAVEQLPAAGAGSGEVNSNSAGKAAATTGLAPTAAAPAASPAPMVASAASPTAPGRTLAPGTSVAIAASIAVPAIQKP